MPAILFLLPAASQAANDNHIRLPDAFEQLGWQVVQAPQDNLTVQRAKLLCGEIDLHTFDLCWHLGFGNRRTFLDRMQMLMLLDPERLVTLPQALIGLHGKLLFPEHMPETYMASDPRILLEPMRQGGEWIAKPCAGSFGRDVHRLRDRRQAETVIVQLTRTYGYAMVQRYVPEIELGEKRILTAGGRLIGWYLRQPTDAGSTNLALGANPVLCTLSADERALAGNIATRLKQRGVGFAAIDIAYPYLIEVNVANPGGLGTLSQLGIPDAAAAAARAIVDAL